MNRKSNRGPQPIYVEPRHLEIFLNVKTRNLSSFFTQNMMNRLIKYRKELPCRSELK